MENKTLEVVLHGMTGVGKEKIAEINSLLEAEYGIVTSEKDIIQPLLDSFSLPPIPDTPEIKIIDRFDYLPQGYNKRSSTKQGNSDKGLLSRRKKNKNKKTHRRK